jgi:hypothetical protein
MYLSYFKYKKTGIFSNKLKAYKSNIFFEATHPIISLQQ